MTLNGAHLCCGGCVKGVKEALAKVDGISEVKADRKAKKLVLIGKDIELLAAIEALSQAGFHTSLK